MDSLVIILLILVCSIIILPIIILSKISSLRSEMRYVNSLLDSLRDEIKYMNQAINAMVMSKSQTFVQEEVSKIETVMATPEKEEVPETPDITESSYIPEKETILETPDVSVEDTYPEYHRAAMERPSSDIIITQEPDDSDFTPPVDNDIDERNVFERFLGTNWLSKAGIITLVLGIGFFVKYAIDQEWINEVGRVGIGLITGAIIIGIAHKLKAKYHVFSSILVGGGIAVFYITITLAFREYGLFGDTLAFALLIITTIFSVILSILYNRKELAIFSLLGGFASPLMVSTGEGNYVVLFSYIFILNTGMLILSYIKKWRIIGIISFVLTLAFFWTWIFNSYKNQFFSVSLFISLFFIQFYLLSLIDHYKSQKKISAYQVFLILINNFSTFLAFIYVFNNYHYDVSGLITISLAVINAVVLVILFRNSRIDRNIIYLIIAIVLSFVSLAIPIQLKGNIITLFWAAESVILLLLWQKSRIKIFYTGFILISILVLISYFMDINNLYSFKNAMPFLANRLFITGVVVIAAFVINMLLLKRDSTEEQYKKQFFGIYSFILIALAYIVPFIEIDTQLAKHTSLAAYEMSYLRYTALATYTTIYIAVLGFIYNKYVSTNKYIFGLLYSAVILYVVFYTNFVADLRYSLFYSVKEYFPTGYFSIHLFSLPAIAYIIYLVTKNIKSYSVWLSWLLAISVVVILSIETENIVIWLFGNPENYYSVLYDVRTFGYPILWGIIAMILMIWGLNRKEALLRKISLVFFAFIVVKFYAYDVWKMSQSGRIISFVLLGVILLLVSFLQQKIKTWVKEDKETENENKEINQ